MTKGQAEALIKEKMSQLFKEIVGKGPSNIYISIAKNYIIMEVRDGLLTAEKQILQLENGMEKVKDLEYNIFKVSYNKYKDLIKNILGVEVLDFLVKINIKEDIRYVCFICDKNIEEKFKQ